METDLILFLIELYGVAGWLASSSLAGDPKHFIISLDIPYISSFFCLILFFQGLFSYQSLVSFHHYLIILSSFLSAQGSLILFFGQQFFSYRSLVSYHQTSVTGKNKFEQERGGWVSDGNKNKRFSGSEENEQARKPQSHAS